MGHTVVFRASNKLNVLKYRSRVNHKTLSPNLCKTKYCLDTLAAFSAPSRRQRQKKNILNGRWSSCKTGSPFPLAVLPGSRRGKHSKSFQIHQSAVPNNQWPPFISTIKVHPYDYDTKPSMAKKSQRRCQLFFYWYGISKTCAPFRHSVTH